MGEAPRLGWRQTIEVAAGHRLGMLAISRDAGRGPEPLNPAIPGFEAHRTPIFAAGQPGGTAQAPLPAAAVVDLGLPADAATATWTVFGADEFGRWSDPATLMADAPARPRSPLPQPRVALVRDPAVAAAGPGPLSPGVIRFELDVPDADRLAPGARPITEVTVEVTGAGQRSGPPGAPHAAEIAAPELEVGESRRLDWSVRFGDGTPPLAPDEATARGSLLVNDARRA